MKNFYLFCFFLLSYSTIQAAEIPELKEVMKLNEGAYSGENVESSSTNECAIRVNADEGSISVNFVSTDLSDNKYTLTENFIEDKLTETGPYHYDYYQVQTKSFIISFNKSGIIYGVDARRDTNQKPEGCGLLKSIKDVF